MELGYLRGGWMVVILSYSSKSFQKAFLQIFFLKDTSFLNDFGSEYTKGVVV